MKVSPEREQRPEKYKDFLRKNPLAKIVILVDTHSTQEGTIMTGVDEEGHIYSDFLGPVSDKNCWILLPYTRHSDIQTLSPPKHLESSGHIRKGTRA